MISSRRKRAKSIQIKIGEHNFAKVENFKYLERILAGNRPHWRYRMFLRDRIEIAIKTYAAETMCLITMEEIEII